MDWISTLQAGLKLAVMLAYAAFGVSLLSSAAGRRIPGIAIPPLAVKALLGTVVVLIWFNFTLRGYMFVLSAALGIAIFAATDQAWRSRKLVFTGAAVVILSISLAWWLPTTTGRLVAARGVCAGFRLRASRFHAGGRTSAPELASATIPAFRVGRLRTAGEHDSIRARQPGAVLAGPSPGSLYSGWRWISGQDSCRFTISRDSMALDRPCRSRRRAKPRIVGPVWLS